MKVSADNYIDGSKPGGDTLPAEQLTEVQAADGSCWAHIVVPDGMTATAKIQRDADSAPEAIDVRLNPSFAGPVVEADGAVSARAGWPRLVVDFAALPEADPEFPDSSFIGNAADAISVAG